MTAKGHPNGGLEDLKMAGCGLFSMFCGSGTDISVDKIRRNFDGERTALPMRT
jgi:hypothetical protein